VYNDYIVPGWVGGVKETPLLKPDLELASKVTEQDPDLTTKFKEYVLWDETVAKRGKEKTLI